MICKPDFKVRNENMNELITIDPEHLEIGKNYLILKEEISDEELAEVFTSLKTVESSILWLLGDFLNFTELRKSEAYAKALAGTHYKPETLYHAKKVCRHFPPSLRKNVSYSHHKEAIGLCKRDVNLALKFLGEAERENLSVKEMKDYITDSIRPPLQKVEHFVDIEWLTLLDAFGTIIRFLENLDPAKMPVERLVTAKSYLGDIVEVAAKYIG